jgi:acyl-CoA thioester hydrolase
MLCGRAPSSAPENMTDKIETQRLPIRVYYEDTDFSGFVQHVAYLRFFERGRTEFLRARGIDQSKLFAAEALVFVVRKMSVDYAKPARMDDELCVETAIAKLGGASIEMRQRILRGEDLIAEAQVRIAAVAGGRRSDYHRQSEPCSDLSSPDDAGRRAQRLRNCKFSAAGGSNDPHRGCIGQARRPRFRNLMLTLRMAQIALGLLNDRRRGKPKK